VAKLRLDKLLTDRGLVSSRERAQAMILAGRVLVNEQKIEKPGTQVDEQSPVRLLGNDLRYVSRGGLKLEHALKHWGIDVRGETCVDIGVSTGGFTDCLLQHGAARVIAIDTGYGQMNLRVRDDARVRLLEKTNARYLTAESIGEPVQFMAMDVSFISATLVLPAAVQSIRAVSGATALEAVVLVKPQFEAGRGQVGKGGIIRDAATQQAAVEKVSSAMRALEFAKIEITESPILGSEGNKEFLLYGVSQGERPDSR